MIYMTTDEWKEISALITAHDFDKLATGIASRTYDLNISQEELDALVTGAKKVNKEKDMNNKDFALVHGYFRGTDDADGEMVLVPTKEEYNDFKQRIDNRFDMLSKRIEALENEKAK